MVSLVLFDGAMASVDSSRRNAPGTTESYVLAQSLRRFAIVALLITFATAAVAQRAGFAAPAHSAAPLGAATRGFRSHNRNFVFGRGANAYGPRRSSPYPYAPYSSLPFPFFGDFFDPGDIYSTGYPVASEPPAFVLQSAREMAAGSSADYIGPGTISRNQRESQSSQPLMIELQGDRYVRVDRAAIDGEALPLNEISSDSMPVATAAGESNRSSALTAPASDLAPAVLIFRDGHSEEVRDYTIADGTLYVRGDYYTDGYWNKKIELSSLDLSQTIEANASRHIKFALPSSPNEVITRP